MSKKTTWDVIWTVIKFILTLGLSHIANRESRKSADFSKEVAQDETPLS